MTNQLKYHLYASRTQQVPNGVEYSFTPSHKKYTLVYSDKEVQGFTLIPEDTPLTTEETAFIAKAKLAINAKYMSDHKDEYAEFLTGFLERLEIELAKAKKNNE